MAFPTSNTLDRAYASDNKGLYVYGSYKGADYEGPNSLASQAGGTDISPENVTPFDAFTQADLHWKINSRPVDVDGVRVPEYQALVRSDRGNTLAIHKQTYTPVQNAELLDMFCFLRDSATITNILQINGGRKIYITADINVQGEVLPGDIVKRQLHVTNAHDGTCAFKAFFTDKRLWCMNEVAHMMSGGFTFAQKENPNQTTSHRHTTSVSSFVRKLPAMIDLQTQTFTKQIEAFHSLACTKITPESARRVLEACFADKLAKPIVDKTALRAGMTRDQATRARALEDLPEIETIRSHAYGGTGMGMHVPGTRGALWGLYNAITQFHTHDAGRQKNDQARAISRLEALYGGVAAERNSRALEACLALV